MTLRLHLPINKFQSFAAYQTSAGITLENAEHAIAYASMHDGIHLGYTLALARAQGL